VASSSEVKKVNAEHTSSSLFMSESMHVRWNEKYVVEEVTGKDCEWAAWLYSQYGRRSTFLFWDTVRDLMLAGF
jgi:hypothetical protein